MVQFVDFSLNNANPNHLLAQIPQLRLQNIGADLILEWSQGEKVKSNMCETTQKQWFHTFSTTGMAILILPLNFEMILIL